MRNPAATPPIKPSITRAYIIIVEIVIKSIFNKISIPVNSINIYTIDVSAGASIIPIDKLISENANPSTREIIGSKIKLTRFLIREQTPYT